MRCVVLAFGFVLGFGVAVLLASLFGLASNTQLVATRRSIIPKPQKRIPKNHLLGEFGYAKKNFASRSHGKIKCFLRGEEVSILQNDDCHGKPPFWRWWHEYRNCYVSAFCVRHREATIYGVSPHSETRRTATRPACVNWLGPEQFTVQTSENPPPINAHWHKAFTIHVSRILPGHFGHDVLNTLVYVFETIRSFDPQLLESLGHADLNERPRLFPLNEGDTIVPSTVLDQFILTNSFKNETHCFEMAALSVAHTADAHLVFRRNSPTRKKKQFWHHFRNVLIDVIQNQSKHIFLNSNKCAPPRITIMVRSTIPNSSSALTANGRGRRLTNTQALVHTLRNTYPTASIRVADPGTMSLAAQQLLAMRTDILISRMGSNVVHAIFLPADSLCLEIEAPDPAHLYYDHPSTFEELAEIFDHEFRRSTIDTERNAKVPHVADPHVATCCKDCLGPPKFHGLVHPPSARQCCLRCAQVQNSDQNKEDPDSYQRPLWFMNWWLANTEANIPEIVDFIAQYLEARPHRFFSCGKIKPSLTAVKKQAKQAACVYQSSVWEQQWLQRVRRLKNIDDDAEWSIGCTAMQHDKDRATRWLQIVAANGQTDTKDIMSYWSCGGVVEPLVGHLRHPFFHCIGPLKDTVELMFSTAYLLLANVSTTPWTNSFFFDAGASSAYNNCWWGCTKWFIDEYERRGLRFDRILLWEARSDINHSHYWSTVPAELRPRMSYYNVPLSANMGHHHHLWTTLKALVKPDDFVAVKLDIDNHDIEVALVRQLLNSPDLISLIDEFFWEHHVYDSPLKRTRVSLFDSKNLGWHDQVPSRNSPDSSLADSYNLLLQLRQAGIRAHSWI